jgi:hypothetical protein
MKRVQNITFPPHYHDTPDSIPVCKGFVLVTLSSEDDVRALLDAWPWDSGKRSANIRELDGDDITTEANDQSAEERSAKTSGMRTCSKIRWEELRAEYLLHRQRLIDEINQYQDEEEARWQKGNMDEGQAERSRNEDDVAFGMKREEVESTARYEAGLHSDSPYPTGCLVFIRHVHSATNKTTLRKLFSQIWPGTEGNDAIDYIDYSKNMDSVGPCWQYVEW